MTYLQHKQTVIVTTTIPRSAITPATEPQMMASRLPSGSSDPGVGCGGPEGEDEGGEVVGGEGVGREGVGGLGAGVEESLDVGGESVMEKKKS